MTKWIEDWFGSEYYCLLYKHRSSDEAKLFLDQLIAILKLEAGKKILDCGCGRGRHAGYLAKKRFDVTGIDISEKNILTANKSGSTNLHYYTHDSRNIFRTNYFDVVLSLFTSFGYFEKDTENNKSIRSMAIALKKDGWFVLDFMNSVKEKKELVRHESSKCKKVKFEIKRFTGNNCFVKEISVSDSKKKISYREQVKAYAQTELENFFRQNGLAVVHLFGDYNLNPFDETKSDRLILIGKKIK